MDRDSVRAISATEAKNRFGAVLREVARTGGPILIERDGAPVAVILSLHAYETACQGHERFSADQIELARSAFGMWANRADIQDDWLERGRERWRSDWRDG